MDANITIPSLNDDCLRDIFCLLEVKDRIKVERVCRKWKEVSNLSWSNYRNLIISKEEWGFKSFYYNSIKFIEEKIISSVLSRCGKFLESIEFDNYCTFIVNENGEYPKFVLGIIADKCPSIQSIKIVGDELIGKRGLKQLSKKCRNITHLFLGDDAFLKKSNFDKELSILFANNKNLKSLVLNCQCFKIKGSCFSNLSFNNLETLIIECHHQNEISIAENLIEIIPKLINLKVFKTNLTEDCEQFEQVINSLQNCHALEELSFKGNDHLLFAHLDYEFSILFENSKKLKAITFISTSVVPGECLLNLNPDSINEINFSYCEFLSFRIGPEFLHRFPNLQIFEFSNISQESTQSRHPDEYKRMINSIASLDKLQKLNLNKNLFVTDDVLKLIGVNLTNIFVLNLSNCPITDEGLEAISKLPNLEDLNVSENKEITGKGLNFIVNLKKLNCSECDKLVIEVILKVIENSKYLEFLDVNDCLNLSMMIRLIDFANEVTKSRKNNKILKIVIDLQVQTYLNKIESPSPYLQFHLY